VAKLKPQPNEDARLGSRYTEALSSNTRRGSIYQKMTILSGLKSGIGRPYVAIKLHKVQLRPRP
jgi:hypothetical protein